MTAHAFTPGGASVARDRYLSGGEISDTDDSSLRTFEGVVWIERRGAYDGTGDDQHTDDRSRRASRIDS
ncbi:hypothetical protein [Acetobacter malorum]|uniref:hypothetical protein n=1 Tax=Acetobacter malorum TaxID=178901 RepID=UPI0012E8134E|nr:hypothetical protein [Acetobacter malorum]